MGGEDPNARCAFGCRPAGGWVEDGRRPARPRRAGEGESVMDSLRATTIPVCSSSAGSLRDSVDRNEIAEESLEPAEGPTVGAIAERPVGILVDLHEERVDADGDGRAREEWHELA